METLIAFGTLVLMVGLGVEVISTTITHTGDHVNHGGLLFALCGASAIVLAMIIGGAW